jgi:hypothetical protein
MLTDTNEEVHSRTLQELSVKTVCTSESKSRHTLPARLDAKASFQKQASGGVRNRL